MATKKMAEMSAAQRKAQIVEVGARLASKHGAANVTRRMVAKAAKVSEPLVSHHMGTAAEAQKAYTRKAKSLGLALPDANATALIGRRLRAHKPKDARDTRKRSVKEVKAITRKGTKVAAKKSSKSGSSTPSTSRKPAAADQGKARAPSKPGSDKPAGESNKMAPGPSENKRSAARAPKLPPLPVMATLPPLPVLPPLA